MNTRYHRTLIVTFAVCLTTVAFLCVMAGRTHGVTLQPGDIVVNTASSIYRVDPVTGDRVIISSLADGGSPDLGYGIEIEASGDILVASMGLGGAVFRIDPDTGDSSVVSNTLTGSGPDLGTPVGIAVEPTGGILVSSHLLGVPRILRIDPITGDRTIVSDGMAGSVPGDPGVMVPMQSPTAVALDTGGDLLVADSLNGAVYRVDVSTGDFIFLTPNGLNTGPDLVSPFGISTHSTLGILVTDQNPRLLRVDPVTGDRTIVSDSTHGTGPLFGNAYGVAEEATGDILVGGLGSGLMRVDPVTGDRTILSDSTHGTGVEIGLIRGITVVSALVPDPLPGDGNGDGWVNGLDYLIWASNFGTHPGADGDISDGDYNDDGSVDGIDYLLWAGNFGTHAATAVPEPMSLTTALLALVGFLVVSGRRRGVGSTSK